MCETATIGEGSAACASSGTPTRLLIILLMALALSVVAGCVPSDPENGANIGGRLSEVAITAIQSQISADPRMSGAQIEVGGDRKAVVLGGMLQNEGQRSIAIELVHKYNKDLEVKDTMTVLPGAPATTAPLY